MRFLLSTLVLFTVFIAIQAEESNSDAESTPNVERVGEDLPPHLVPKKTTKRGAYGYGYGYGFAPYGYGDYGIGYPYRTYSYSPYRFLYPYYGGYYGGFGGYGGYGYYGW